MCLLTSFDFLIAGRVGVESGGWVISLSDRALPLYEGLSADPFSELINCASLISLNLGNFLLSIQITVLYGKS